MFLSSIIFLLLKDLWIVGFFFFNFLWCRSADIKFSYFHSFIYSFFSLKNSISFLEGISRISI